MPSLNPKSYILNSNARGFIAITTSIILSLLTLAIAAVFGSSAFLTRFNNLDFYHKKTSYFLARTCLEYARLKLAENINYAGGETRIVDAYQCAILPIESSPPNKIIKTRAQVSGATTNLKLVANGSTLSAVSLEEVVKF